MPEKRWQDGNRCDLLAVPSEDGKKTLWGSAVHQHSDGAWWFWDEIGVDEYGPYSSHSECRSGAEDYSRQL
jgi:hypothetical protein